MSHYAKVSNGIVEQVIVADAEVIATLEGEWVQTSFNTNGGIHYGQDGKPDGGPAIGYNFAGVGMNWDGVGFYHSQPFPSWTFNRFTYQWEPPIPLPSEGGPYLWDETSKTWIS